MTATHLYRYLAHELPERAGRASVSQLGPCNPALASHLRNRLCATMGQPGSFVAPAVVESLFDWEKHDQPFASLPWLCPALIDAMDAPPADLADYRFPRTRLPFLHQYNAWRSLEARPPRSVLVGTGTASGKTECFLVPILNDLARELDGQPGGGPLVGVRALFLYPLNALINSQRQRLAAWTHGFRDRMRFCLYNGATPHQLPAHERNRAPNEARSRRQLRESPPPILVTNATMLEFMLVRSEDEPILAQSQGTLRWIVLDEAHTYVGSQAAELALLLRRVLHAFGADRDAVRFVATSATIGDREAGGQLRCYLADLAGVTEDRVDVIEGRRVSPDLPGELTLLDESLPSLDQLRAASERECFELLCSVPAIRALRDALRDDPHSLLEIARRLTTNQPERDGSDPAAAGPPADLESTLEILDHCARARESTGAAEALLPTRVHLFQRNQRGMWACCNHQCSERGDLDVADWRFGKVFLERHEQCACGSRVYELIFCNDCGAEYLITRARNTDRGQTLVPYLASEGRLDDDESPDLEDDIGEEDESGWALDVELLAGSGRPESIAAVRIDPRTGRVQPSDDVATCTVYFVERDRDRTTRRRCARCGQRHSARRPIFRQVWLGAPFYLGVAIPALLDSLPVESQPEPRPAGGRRLLTFSDSRQGTARFALRAQLDAERNFVRSLVYHTLLAEVRPPDQDRITALQNQIAALEPQRDNPVVGSLLSDLEAQLAALGDTTARMSWRAMVERLAENAELRWINQSHQQRYRAAELSREDAAKIGLYRELVRRPRRQSSLETLGLVGLRYPALATLSSSSVPDEWTTLGGTLENWRDFLKIALDFSIRAWVAVQIPGRYLRWFGTHITNNVVVAPDDPPVRNQRYPWPSASRERRLVRLARLVETAFELDASDPDQRGVIDAILRHAWRQVYQTVLAPVTDGYILDFDQHVELQLVNCGWICPITRRVFDTTLRAVSPYQTESWRGNVRCEPIDMPRPPHPFCRIDGTTRPGANDDWLATDAAVARVRSAGVWTEYSDRIASMAPYFQVAEHSAQISSRRLDELEKRFRKCELNVLSCSTTMEMGIDIGGLHCVAMNNAPPGPANFLQRAGRAGRRGQSQAITLTNCQSTPHGEAVFRNPMWPFTTPVHVPTVSLHSERIVRRHVNAMVLARYLRDFTHDQHRLTCEWFYVPPTPGTATRAERFRQWVEGQAFSDTALAEGLRFLLANTLLDSVRLSSDFFGQIATALRRNQTIWSDLHGRLVADLEDAGGPPQAERRNDPIQRALWIQLCRLRKEYLLKALASSGFLPSYGFPLHVLPFVNTTAEQIANERRMREMQNADDNAREDQHSQTAGYPSRPLAIAIREYAPGSSVVIGGVVYQSRGLTLHWRLPPQDEQLAEEQLLRWAWRCRSCYHRGFGMRRPEQCARCNNATLSVWRFIEPSGFAVDIQAQPDNDLSRQVFIPVRDPWIELHSETWLSLVNPAAGRFRYDPDGSIFHWNDGAHHEGYALCLRCGRAASERNSAQDDPALPDTMEGHKRLRGGRRTDNEAECPGNHEGNYAIRRNLRLGGEERTDVVELQLSEPGTGQPVRDATACTSIAVALRQALAESLGIDSREIGWSIRGAPEGQRSILLYDVADGGAGYVASVGENLAQLLRQARIILHCPRECDGACHGCLLAFDTQEAIEHLDRHRALEVLSEDFVAALELPENLQVFGPDTSMEFTSVTDAILRAAASGVQECRVYVGGDPGDWLFSAWRLWPHLVHWLHDGLDVKIIIPEGVVGEMYWDEANALASRLEATGARTMISPGQGVQIDDMYLLAEFEGTRGTFRWATQSLDVLCPGEDWGSAGPDAVQIVYHHTNTALPPLPGEARPPHADELRKPRPGTFQELSVGNQLDGDLGDVGRRFWALVEGPFPGLRSRLDIGPACSEIEYTDRYLNSPLGACVLYKILNALASRSGGLDSRTRLVVKTAIARGRSNQTRLRHDWDGSVKRRALERVLAPLCATVVVDIRNGIDTRHDRGLTLTWSDGTVFIIRPDQGVGFLDNHMHPHDFSVPLEEQARRIRALSTVHVEKGEGPAVAIYLSGLQRR